MEDILKYEDNLKNDDFTSLPLHKFQNSDFLIYNENGEVLFSTNKALNRIITPEELDFINDYYESSYYHVYEKVVKNEIRYHIIKSTDNDSGYNGFLGYAVIDKEYNIIEGNLFPNITKLSERTFNLIRGFHSNNKNIEKLNYETTTKEKRTLVFLSKNISNAGVQKMLNRINKMWLYIIPLFLLVIIIYTYLLVRNIRFFLDPISDALEKYENNNKFILDEEMIPREFEKLIYNFKNLFSKLKKEEERKKKYYIERGRILANLSHDLKIPLTVIAGYSKAFLDEIVPKEKEKEYMMAIYNKCDTATNIINSLLDFTKYENNELKLNYEIVNLCEFLTKYLAQKYYEINLAKFNINVDILNEKILFRIDKLLITRMLDNIIANSLKYNKEGTTIYFKVEKLKKYVRIIIADDGKGIKKELKNNLFEPFISGDASRGPDAGTGLGLAIAKRVVEIHNGKIRIVGVPRKPYKTEFIIEFPLS